jgi:hypothetical protein
MEAIIVAAIMSLAPLIASIVAARRSGRAEQHAAAANHAVNGVSPGEPRILDLVRNIDNRTERTEGKIDRHLEWHLDRGVET